MSTEGSNERVIKSYVWHNGACFFVSTIERESSAMLGPRRFNETLVWRFDWDKRERGVQILFQTSDGVGSIHMHQKTVQAIYDIGELSFEEVE